MDIVDHVDHGKKLERAQICAHHGKAYYLLDNTIHIKTIKYNLIVHLIHNLTFLAFYAVFHMGNLPTKPWPTLCPTAPHLLDSPHSHTFR